MKITLHSVIAIIGLILCKYTASQDPPVDHYGCTPDESGGWSGYRYEQNPSKNVMTSITGNRVECVNNVASGYPCSNVHLESFLTNQDLSDNQANAANDIWGWTSPSTGSEYVLIGLDMGTSFVRIDDCENPVVLGVLPTATVPNFWRDIKVYQNHAFVVSEAGFHGMQVFDLTQLEDVTEFTTFEETALYENVGSAHNIVINEDSGFAYIVGGIGVGVDCDRGLHMVDISDPSNPTFAGCYTDMGYTHDAQCVIYDGPDADYTGREICFSCNEHTTDIIDVTDKENPEYISSCPFTFVYSHQGWLTEDKNYFLIDDELDGYFEWTQYGITDETDAKLSLYTTRTVICDVSDLKRPHKKTLYKADNRAIDHNQYIKGKYAYQSNYRAGLRILDLSCIDFGGAFLNEVAYFDIYPEDDDNEFNANWSNYPFFESGCVVLSGIEQGLFIVRPDIPDIQDDSANFKDLIKKTIAGN